ncbi:MAG: helix-turn-helix domain-containing protein [Clostridia bacterium]|nr:helix-turn-helix domain-containing protein [Clostridia bacterium]
MKLSNKTEQQFYPDKDEIKAAQLACCGRHCSACESPAEYAWRKREVDMSLLLEKAIQKELTNVERSVVLLHWFDGESLTRISQIKNISPAAVKKTLARAQEKLERVLSYAVCYQQNIISETIIPVVLGRARVIAAARNATGGRCGDRIARLRQSQCLPLEALGVATGIKPSRLLKIEHGVQPESDEVIALSEFFSVSADFILKGEKDEGKENIA